MARTSTILTSTELLLIQSLDALATSGATQAIRKSSSTTVANVNLGGSGTPVVSEVPSGTIDGSNPTFTIANTPVAGTLQLYRNGIRQRVGASNDYTLSGTTITFNTGAIPGSGDWLLADYSY